MKVPEKFKKSERALAIVAQIEAETGQCADPLEWMLRLMADPSQTMADRLDAAKACRKAVHPDLQTTQIKGDRDNPLQLQAIQGIMMDPALADAAERIALAFTAKLTANASATVEDIGDGFGVPPAALPSGDISDVEPDGDLIEG